MQLKLYSYMSPKSGPSVLKTKGTKGTQVHLLYPFYFMLFAFSLTSTYAPYHVLFSTRVAPDHPPQLTLLKSTKHINKD